MIYADQTLDISLTIQTTAINKGRCEFCGRPARWRSQEVDEVGQPVRVPVLACKRHKVAGRLLATKAEGMEEARRCNDD